MPKKIIIKRCIECPECVFDDAGDEKHWGKNWCFILDRKAFKQGIPKWCPLPDEKGDE